MLPRTIAKMPSLPSTAWCPLSIICMFFHIKEDNSSFVPDVPGAIDVLGHSWQKSRGRKHCKLYLSTTPHNSMEFLNPWPTSYYVTNLSVYFEHAQSWYKLFSPNLLNSRISGGRRSKTSKAPLLPPTASEAPGVLPADSSHRPRSTSFLFHDPCVAVSRINTDKVAHKCVFTLLFKTHPIHFKLL